MSIDQAKLDALAEEALAAYMKDELADALETANEKLYTCDDCGAKVKTIMGCPDGAEICGPCFAKGNH